MQASDRKSNCFTKAYGHYSEGTGSVYQPTQITRQPLIEPHYTVTTTDEASTDAAPPCRRKRADSDDDDGDEVDEQPSGPRKHVHVEINHAADEACPLKQLRLRYLTGEVV